MSDKTMVSIGFEGFPNDRGVELLQALATVMRAYDDLPVSSKIAACNWFISKYSDTLNAQGKSESQRKEDGI